MGDGAEEGPVPRDPLSRVNIHGPWVWPQPGMEPGCPVLGFPTLSLANLSIALTFLLKDDLEKTALALS